MFETQNLGSYSHFIYEAINILEETGIYLLV